MIERGSRYFEIETATTTVAAPNGPRSVAYKRRRFIPAAGELAPQVEHRFGQGDRLDNITAHYLGDPTQFWRICDANLALWPGDLEEVGRTIVIAVPATEGG